VRITSQQNANKVTIKIEGRLVGPFVAELGREWERVAAGLGSKKIDIDLRSVMYADTSGIALLGEIYENTEAEFLADTPLTKYIAERAMLSKSKKDGNGRASGLNPALHRPITKENGK
jgi:ABC-type transporter Mla MlaB component